MRTLSIIIPVYNEGKLIVEVVDKVVKADSLGLKKEIILVDDGSTDGTKALIQKLEEIHKNSKALLYTLTSIRLLTNQGKGAALKAGFKKATGNILMVQDADNEYSVKDYPTLLEPFMNNNAGIVYGSRNKNRQVFNTKYSYVLFYIGGIALTWIVNLLYGLTLSDQATGYKLFSRELKEILLSPSENGFSYEVAISALLAKKGYFIQEVPIHYYPRSLEEGKKINIMDFIKSLGVAFKYK